MLVRQDLSAAEETAAVVDETVVGGAEHIHVHLGQVQLLEQHAPLVGLVEPDALALGNLMPAGALPLLALLVGHVVGDADLCCIVHLLGTNLYLHIAVGATVKESDVQRLILRPVLIGDIVTVIILILLIE